MFLGGEFTLFGIAVKSPLHCPFRFVETVGKIIPCLATERIGKKKRLQCLEYDNFPDNCPLWTGVRLTINPNGDQK
jgi:hypothetical protein